MNKPMNQQEIAAEMVYRREEYLANLGVFGVPNAEQLKAAEASCKEWRTRYLRSINTEIIAEIRGGSEPFFASNG